MALTLMTRTTTIEISFSPKSTGVAIVRVPVCGAVVLRIQSYHFKAGMNHFLLCARSSYLFWLCDY
jgi:hypothetical protein